MIWSRIEITYDKETLSYHVFGVQYGIRNNDLMYTICQYVSYLRWHQILKNIECVITLFFWSKNVLPWAFCWIAPYTPLASMGLKPTLSPPPPLPYPCYLHKLKSTFKSKWPPTFTAHFYKKAILIVLFMLVSIENISFNVTPLPPFVLLSWFFKDLIPSYLLHFPFLLSSYTSSNVAHY